MLFYKSYISRMKRGFFVSLAAGTVLFTGIVLLVQAQAPGEPSDAEIEAAGISYPVPELGNCADKNSCRQYCNDPSHMSECVAFAESRGLMNKKEAEQARKFAGRLQEGGGPGGCRSHEECRRFCESIANMETCLAFAEEQGAEDSHVKEGRKVLKYIKSGGEMPGGCTSRESCEAYCGDFNHAEECFAFMERSGLQPEREGEEGEGPRTVEQLRKFVDLAKQGGTPGGCRSKQECEAYCHGEGHFEECVSFGEKMGFIPPEKVEMIRKLGGKKGPGGCSSEESCHEYCSDPARQEECFSFAEQNGLIPAEQLKEAKQGFVRLRQGLEQAPPEVAACLQTHLGGNVLADIQSGQLVPGQQIGERVKGCFEKFGGHTDPREVFKKVPQEVLICAREKLGGEFDQLKNGAQEFTPETGDVFRVCGDQLRLQQGGGFFGPPEGGGQGGEHRGAGMEKLENFLRSAPPGVSECLKGRVDITALQSGTIQPGPELNDSIRQCFQSFRPGEMMGHEGEGRGGEGSGPFGGERQSFDGKQGGTPSEQGGPVRLEYMPSHVKECVGRLGGASASGEVSQDILSRCFTEAGKQDVGGLSPVQQHDGGAGQQPTPDQIEQYKRLYEQGGQATGTPQPSGAVPPPDYNQEYQKQYESQVQQQIQQQYDQQYQQQYQEQYQQQYQQQSGSYPTQPPPPAPPTDGTFQPPPPPPPPQSGLLIRILRRLILGM